MANKFLFSAVALMALAAFEGDARCADNPSIFSDIVKSITHLGGSEQHVNAADLNTAWPKDYTGLPLKTVTDAKPGYYVMKVSASTPGLQSSNLKLSPHQSFSIQCPLRKRDGTRNLWGVIDPHNPKRGLNGPTGDGVPAGDRLALPASIGGGAQEGCLIVDYCNLQTKDKVMNGYLGPRKKMTLNYSWVLGFECNDEYPHEDPHFTLQTSSDSHGNPTFTVSAHSIHYNGWDDNFGDVEVLIEVY